MEKIPSALHKKEESQEKEDLIMNRIERTAGVEGLVSKIASIPNADLQSLLLDVMDKKSTKVGVKEVISSLEWNSFVARSEIDQRIFAGLDATAFQLLPETYRAVELSPLVPFGTNTFLAGISQKRILSTTRNAEVISDPTTALALQCAHERLKKIKEEPKDTDLVDLATSQRVIRQNKLKKTSQTQHFRTFTLMSAGRDQGFEKFEKEKLKEHISFLLNLFEALRGTGGYAINDVEVHISDMTENQKNIDMAINPVIDNLMAVFPRMKFSVNHDRKTNYYQSIYFTVVARNGNPGSSFHIGGGGMTDWTQKLVGSRKERLLFSSVGSEILCRYFRLDNR